MLQRLHHKGVYALYPGVSDLQANRGLKALCMLLRNAASTLYGQAWRVAHDLVYIIRLR
jgi:hypothetical protein